MKYDWDKARHAIDYSEESEGNCKLSLGFEIRIYFESDLKRHADDIQHFYQRAIQTANTEFNYWFTPFSSRYGADGHVHFRKSNKTMHSYLSKWIELEKWEKPFAIELHSSQNDLAVGDTSVQICNEPYSPGYLRLLLPLETFEKSTEEILEMVQYLIGDIDYISGYVGLGVNIFEPSYQSMTIFSDVIPKRIKKFHCIDFTAPYIFKDFEEDGLLNVAWLTLLGKTRSRQSNLRFNSRDDLPGYIKLHKIGSGLCVQAGDFPTMGEAGEDTLDVYRRVCSLLGNAKLSGSRVDPFDSLGSSQLTVDWVDRFSLE